MRKCDSCGKPYQESKDVFCPHCGAVAQKQCTHGSSFDSNRYDRGEIYQTNQPQYDNTTYTQGYEPHAQRKKSPYAQPAKTYKGDYKKPKLNLPDIVKTLTSGNNKGQKPKAGAIIAFCIVIAFNFITGVLNTDDDYSDYEPMTEYEETIDQIYVMVNDATIEMVDADGDFKTFTLTINSMVFDDWLPESVLDEASSGAMADIIVSEDTYVEMLICDFDENIVDEQSHNDVLAQAERFAGVQIGGKCKYEFTYNFDYDEIVYFGNDLEFFLDDGRCVFATLPFTAFTLSEDGKITYYNSFVDEDTDWDAFFSECSNRWERDDLLYVKFDDGE